ncbi:MAG TPA: hypothetical protein VF043_08295 [Ktedonobacteraceae bacterium]
MNDHLLQNTRPHIDTLYIPINKILAKLENTYDEYKIARGRCHGYEIEKRAEVSGDAPESQASVELGLLLYGSKYKAILAFTTVSRELTSFQEKMIEEGSSTFLTTEFEKRLDSFIRFLYGVGIVAHSYLLLFKEVPEGQAEVYVLGTPEFEKEFYTEIDSMRLYIRELALGTTDTLKAPSKKAP